MCNFGLCRKMFWIWHVWNEFWSRCGLQNLTSLVLVRMKRNLASGIYLYTAQLGIEKKNEFGFDIWIIFENAWKQNSQEKRIYILESCQTHYNSYCYGSDEDNRRRPDLTAVSLGHRSHDARGTNLSHAQRRDECPNSGNGDGRHDLERWRAIVRGSAAGAFYSGYDNIGKHSVLVYSRHDRIKNGKYALKM